jgi:hypothetical protein
MQRTVTLFYDSPKKTFTTIGVQAWASDWIGSLGGGGVVAIAFTDHYAKATVTLNLTRPNLNLAEVEEYFTKWNKHYEDLTTIVA